MFDTRPAGGFAGGVYANAEAKQKFAGLGFLQQATNVRQEQQDIEEGTQKAVGRGFLRELGIGIRKFGVDALQSTEKTFQTLGLGFDETVAENEAAQRFSHELDPGRGHKITGAIGNGIGQMVLTMATMAATGGLAAGAGLGVKGVAAAQKYATIGQSMARTYGDTKQRQMDLGVDPTIAAFGALAASGLEASLEFALGGERHINAAMARHLVSKAAGGIALKKTGVQIVGSIARHVTWETSKVMAEESVEEQLQLFGNELIDSLLTNTNQFNLADHIETAIMTPWHVLPMAIVGGGASVMNRMQQEKQIETYTTPPDDTTMKAAFTTISVDPDGNEVVTHQPELETALDTELEALVAQMTESGMADGPESARIGTMLKNMSIRFAATDDEKTSMDYWKDFKTAFLDGDLKDYTDLADLQDRGDATTAEWMAAFRNAVPNFDTLVNKSKDKSVENEAKSTSLMVMKDYQDTLDKGGNPDALNVGREAQLTVAVSAALTGKANGRVALSVNLLPGSVFREAYALGKLKGAIIDGVLVDLDFLKKPGLIIITPAGPTALLEEGSQPTLLQPTQPVAQLGEGTEQTGLPPTTERGLLPAATGAPLGGAFHRMPTTTVVETGIDNTSLRKAETQNHLYVAGNMTTHYVDAPEVYRGGSLVSRTTRGTYGPGTWRTIESKAIGPEGTDLSIQRTEEETSTGTSTTFTDTSRTFSTEVTGDYKWQVAPVVETGADGLPTVTGYTATRLDVDEPLSTTFPTIEDAKAFVAKQGQGPLFSRGESKDGGQPTTALYFGEENLAVFFKNATSTDVIHEWFHHLTEKGLLTSEHMQTLKDTFGGGNWDGKASERAVDALILYLREGKFPEGADVKLVNAFSDVGDIFNTAYASIKARRGDGFLSSQATKAFDAMFGKPDVGNIINKITGDTVQLAAEKANVHAHVVVLESRGIETDDLDKKGLLDRANGAFHGHKAFKRAAKKKYPDKKSTSELDEVQLKTLINLARAKDRRVSPAELDIAARKWGDKDTFDEMGFDQQKKVLDKIDKAMHKLLKDAEEAQTQEEIEAAARAAIKPEVDEVDAQQDRLTDASDTVRRENATGGAGQFAWLTRRVEQIKRGLKTFGRNVSKNTDDIDTLTYFMSDGERKGALFVNVTDPILAANKQAAFVLDEYKKFITDTMKNKTKGFDEKQQGVPNHLHKVVDVAGKRFTLSELLTIYMHTRGDVESNGAIALKKAENDLGNTPDEVIRQSKAIIEGDKQIKAFAETMDEFFTTIWPELDRTYRILNNQPERGSELDSPESGFGLGEQPLYFPIQRRNGFFVENDWAVQKGILPKQGKGVVAGIPSATKKRGDTATAAIELDASFLLKNYLEQMSTYIAKFPTIQRAGAIVNASKGSFFARFGDHTQTEALLKLINREQYFNGRQEAMSTGERHLASVRRTSIPFYLGLNFRSVAIQPASFWGGVGELGWAEAVPAMSTYAKAFAYAMKRLPGWLKSTDGSVLSGFLPYETQKRLSPQSLRGGADQDLEDLGKNGVGATKIAGRTLTDLLMSPQQLADQITVTSLWYTAFQSKVKELGENRTSQDVEQEAARYADRIVSDTQPGRTVTDRGLIQTGDEKIRMFIPFSSQKLADFKFLRKMIFDFKIAFKRGKAANPDNPNVGGFTEAWNSLFVRQENGPSQGKRIFFKYMVTPLALGMIVRGRLPDEKEYMMDMLLWNVVGSVPIIGPLMSTMMMYNWRDAPAEPLFLGLVKKVAQVGTDVLGGEVTDETAYDFADTVFQGAGVPKAFVKIAQEATGDGNYGEAFYNTIKDDEEK